MKLWKHQAEALKYFTPRNYGALYTKPGTGKTRIMLDLITKRDFKITLVVCPKKVCRVWPAEFNKHYRQNIYKILDVSGLPGERKVTEIKKTLKLNKSVHLIIVNNYDSVWREPLRNYLLKVGLDCVICDESHRIKTPGSKVSRFLALLGKRVPNRFLMTGTPLAQSPLDIYAQYRFLNPEIFGTNYGVFKNQYANWIITAGGFPMLNKSNPYKNLDELHEKMFSCAFMPEVHQNLPAVQDIPWEFDLPGKTEKYYRELRKEGVLELKQGLVDPGNVLAVIVRLQQLTSGYLPTDEGVVKIDTARKDAFKELISSLPEEEPIVVFARFIPDIRNIRNAVREIGRKSSEISGRRDTSGNWYSGKTSVLAVQISAGSEGIDLTRARYGIYYTKTHSLWQYQQSRKRLHRPGQDRPTIFYHITGKLTKGKTIDELINDSLESNQELIESILTL